MDVQDLIVVLDTCSQCDGVRVSPSHCDLLAAALRLAEAVNACDLGYENMAPVEVARDLARDERATLDVYRAAREAAR
jgi:hypothetical protein